MVNICFKEWLQALYVEMDRTTIKVADEAHDDVENYSFPELFEKMHPGASEKTRFVIPLGGFTPGHSILQKIDDLGYEIDFSDNTVEVPMQTRQGTKPRKIALGKFILAKDSQFKKSPFTEEERQWFASRGNAVDALKKIDEQDLAVIISRNPYDILRMGDFDVRSCHSKGGQFFQCAIDETKNSGGIAYVVKKSDLAKVDLDDPEIFKDPERGVPGIEPLSRMRIRKFVHDDTGQNLAIPEKREYAQNAIPGFYETLREFLLSKQQEIFGKERPRLKNFSLAGGHYQDTKPAAALFNLFFGDRLDSGEAKLLGGKVQEDAWQIEVDDVNKQNYNNKFVFIHGEIDEADGAMYVSYNASVQIEVDGKYFTKEFTSLVKDESSTYIHDSGLNELLKKFARYHDFGAVNDVAVELDRKKKVVTFRWDLYDEDSQANPDAYREYSDYLRSQVDDKKDEIISAFYAMMREEEYIYVPLYLPKDYNYEDDTHEVTKQPFFKHFKIEFDDKEYDPNFTTKFYYPILEGDALKAVGKAYFIFDKSIAFRDKLQKKIMKFEQLAANLKRKPFLEEFMANIFVFPISYVPDVSAERFDKASPETHLGINAHKNFKDKKPTLLVNFTVQLKTLEYKEETLSDGIEFITYLDNNFEQLLAAIRDVYIGK